MREGFLGKIPFVELSTSVVKGRLDKKLVLNALITPSIVINSFTESHMFNVFKIMINALVI